MSIIQFPQNFNNVVNTGESEGISYILKNLPPLNNQQEGVRDLSFFKEINDNYIIIPNLTIFDENGKENEIDCLVIAPNAIYVIDWKDWNWEEINILDSRTQLELKSGNRIEKRDNPLNRAHNINNSLKYNLEKMGIRDHLFFIHKIVFIKDNVKLNFENPNLSFSNTTLNKTFINLKDLKQILINDNVGNHANKIKQIQRHLSNKITSSNIFKSRGDVYRLEDKYELSISEYKKLQQAIKEEKEIKVQAKKLVYGNRITHANDPIKLKYTPVTIDHQIAINSQKRFEENKEIENKIDSENLIKTIEILSLGNGTLEVFEVTNKFRPVSTYISKFSIEQLIDFSVKFLTTLKDIHKEEIFHRNLNPDNIYVKIDNNGIKVKIADFNKSYYKDTIVRSHNDINTRFVASQSIYNSPEISDKDFNFKAYSYKETVDLYSFGVIFYELLRGFIPANNYVELDDKIKSGSISLKSENSVDNWFDELFKKLCNIESEKRFKTCDEVLGFIKSNDKKYRVGQEISVYNIDKVISETNISTIFKVKENSNKDFVIKLYKKEYNALADRETDILEDLKNHSHLKVIKYITTQMENRFNSKYIVLEYIEGENLQAKYLDKSTKITNKNAIKLLNTLLDIVSYLHNKRQTSHLDIKPSNIMEKNIEGEFKLIDFNISTNEENNQLPMGTYIPPDFQINDPEKMQSYDTYAIGVTLYNLLCGENKLNRNNPENPIKINNDIPKSFGEFILKSVQPLYNNRFKNIDEMIDGFKGLEEKIKKEERDKKRENLLPEDIFSIHKDVIGEYSDFIRESILISNDVIKKKINKELESNKYWPEPLIQFNPAFKKYDTIKNLSENGFLHRSLVTAIGTAKSSDGNYKVLENKFLYRHQYEAISKVKENKGFILTSGTGSGKTLSFLSGIFDSLLREKDLKGEIKGVKAILVYPMNALVNSQYEEIESYTKSYKQFNKSEFPISCMYYTGDSNEEQRNIIKNGNVNIILTNYMMLEYILTRSGDKELRDSIFKNIEFLVFDEIHMYRGRQGSDIAMLIRRILAETDNDVKCIGTSATMVSDGSVENRKSVIANFASKIFGKKFDNDQIIMETLDKYFSEIDINYDFSESLIESVKELNKYSPDILIKEIEFTEENLKNSSLSLWLENRISLTQIPYKSSYHDDEDKEFYVTRGTPLRLEDIAKHLSEETQLDVDYCKNALKIFLKCIAKVNKEIKDKGLNKSYLPYKLHQFICETEGVYLTLNYDDLQENEKNKYIGLSPENHSIKVEDKNYYIYSTSFSRTSGKEFIEVYKNNERLFSDNSFETEDNQLIKGYLIPCSKDNDELKKFYSFYQDNSDLIKKDNVEVVYYRADGKYVKESGIPSYNSIGLFIKEKFTLDPTSGVEYHHSSSDFSKLSKLGNEGRSSASTMITYLTLKNIENYNYSDNKKKLLSFTDNRQDASLQSGHFNDFVSLVEIRKIIYNVVKIASENNEKVRFKYLNDNSESIINKILDIYGLESNFEKFASNDYNKQVNINLVKSALKNYLELTLLADLKNNWRVIFPNLEQCGLIEIDYENSRGESLKYLCKKDDEFLELGFLHNLNYEQRLEFFKEILDYFRNNLAINNNLDINLEENNKRLNEKYHLNNSDKPLNIYISTVKKTNDRLCHTVTVRNKLGKYISSVSLGTIFDKPTFTQFIDKIFTYLTDKGFLVNDDKKRLLESTIIYQFAEKDKVKKSRVQTKSQNSIEIQTNKFFSDLYKNEYDESDILISKEHTAQIKSDERKLREEEFRGKNGKQKINILFCSPTMELGIDISELDIVHMRNVPPSPANYVQRSGRAGRSGQTALVFINCSSSSAHDMHYFNNQEQMVSGQVKAPIIEIDNEDLVSAHIHSVCLSNVSLTDEQGDLLSRSILDLLNENANYRLKSDIDNKLQLSFDSKNKITDISKKITRDIVESNWLNDKWIDNKVNSFRNDFDKSLNRWRELFKASVDGEIKYSKLVRTNNDENDKMSNSFKRQKIILMNGDKRVESEFYPYKYLASEGFIPGYSFPIQPVRVFLNKGNNKGEFFSRPPELAITEFAPDNYIYHSGIKYQVDYVINKNPNDKAFKEIPNSGFMLRNNETFEGNSPFDGSIVQNCRQISDCFRLGDMGAKQIFNITCMEEQRQKSQQFLDKYFSANLKEINNNKVELKDQSGHILSFWQIDSADIIYINSGHRKRKFLLNGNKWINTVEYENIISKDPNNRDTIECSIYTQRVSDILFIIPDKKVFDETQVVSFQYAIKKAIEIIFNAESSEIGCFLIGSKENSNILIYENTQGSIKVLSKLKNPLKFKEVINKATEICFYETVQETKELIKITDTTVKATYKDIKSYYNQSDHSKLDKWSIEKILDRLSNIEDYGIDRSLIRDTQETYNIDNDILSQIPETSIMERYLVQSLKEKNIQGIENFSGFEKKDKYSVLHFARKSIVMYKNDEDKETLEDDLNDTLNKMLIHCAIDSETKINNFIERKCKNGL